MQLSYYNSRIILLRGQATGSCSLARQKAPIAITRSRTAISYKPPAINTTAMATSHADTTKAPSLVYRSTRKPATISITPTIIMKVAGASGNIFSTGRIYAVQSVNKLVNLSAPATIGTSAYVYFNMVRTVTVELVRATVFIIFFIGYRGRKTVTNFVT